MSTETRIRNFAESVKVALGFTPDQRVLAVAFNELFPRTRISTLNKMPTRRRTQRHYDHNWEATNERKIEEAFTASQRPKLAYDSESVS